MTTEPLDIALETVQCRCDQWICRLPGEPWRHLATGTPRCVDGGTAEPKQKGQAA